MAVGALELLPPGAVLIRMGGASGVVGHLADRSLTGAARVRDEASGGVRYLVQPAQCTGLEAVAARETLQVDRGWFAKALGVVFCEEGVDAFGDEHLAAECLVGDAVNGFFAATGQVDSMWAATDAIHRVAERLQPARALDMSLAAGLLPQQSSEPSARRQSAFGVHIAEVQACFGEDALEVFLEIVGSGLGEGSHSGELLSELVHPPLSLVSGLLSLREITRDSKDVLAEAVDGHIRVVGHQEKPFIRRSPGAGASCRRRPRGPLPDRLSAPPRRRGCSRPP